MNDGIQFGHPARMQGRKVCVWIKDGLPIRGENVPIGRPTLPDSGEIIFLVSFDSVGQFDGAELHFESMTVRVDKGQTGLIYGNDMDAKEF